MVDCDPLFGVETEALTQEVQAALTHLNVLRDLNYTGIYVFNKLSLISPSERRLTEYGLIEGDSEAPNVYLMVVELVIENFWGHVQRGATVKLDHLILTKSCGEAEITKFHTYSDIPS